MKQVELYRDGLTKVYEEDRQKLRMKSYEYQELVFTRLKDLVTGLNTICSKHFVSEVETNREIRQAFLDAFGDISQSTRLDASRALSQSESTGDKGKGSGAQPPSAQINALDAPDKLKFVCRLCGSTETGHAKKGKPCPAYERAEFG